MLKGQLTISRVTSNQRDTDYMTIRLTDKSSSIAFVEVEVEMFEMMNALTGKAYVPCQFDLRGTHLVGKIREVKNELLDALPWEATKEDVRNAIIPFEVDGWIGSDYDMGNHHNRTQDGKMKVSFHRFLDPPQVEE